MGFLEPRIVKVNQIRTPIISPAIIGDHSPILNTEVENSIIMEGAHIDCGKRITDSLIGRKVKILNQKQNLPRGHRAHPRRHDRSHPIAYQDELNREEEIKKRHIHNSRN